MNQNEPSHFGHSVINLLVLEVGSYIIRIRQVLGHFVMLENLNHLTGKLVRDRAASNMAAAKIHLHDDERKVNLYPGLMSQKGVNGFRGRTQLTRRLQEEHLWPNFYPPSAIYQKSLRL